jgi:hypothetical protein
LAERVAEKAMTTRRNEARAPIARGRSILVKKNTLIQKKVLNKRIFVVGLSQSRYFSTSSRICA